jgi:hypothetical protein
MKTDAHNFRPMSPPMSSRSPVARVCLWMLAPLAALGCGPAVEVEPVVAGQPTAVAALSPADQETLGEKWVRVTRDAKKQPQAMETAIVRYATADAAKGGAPKPYVDLVGAVHIGDRAYYEKLNDRFKNYDAVLYELVAPEGTVVPKGHGMANNHPLGALQNGMKSMLEIEHQLEQIDYTGANMVHADLSPDEFFQSMADRDEGFVQMYFKLLGSSVAQQSEQAAEGVSAEFDLMAALLAEDRARQLKIAMAKQFESMESMFAGLSGPGGSTLITERNNRALDVLAEKLDDGEARLAVFYGAGHLADMHEQMAKRFGMAPVSIEWVEAWDLRK